jgi:hypothetical protein
VCLALASWPATAAAEPTTPAPTRQCFWARDVNNFAAETDRVVNVRVGVRDVYQFEMFGLCPDVRWNQRIGLVARGGGDRVCTGLDAELVVPSSIGPRRCPVRNIRKLTPEEVAALPRRARP